MTRGDLPHLLELHSFLERGLEPSPHAASASAAASQQSPPDTTVYGSFPPVLSGFPA